MPAACCARSWATRPPPGRPLIPYNPALRPRNRGRRTGRRLERSPAAGVGHATASVTGRRAGPRRCSPAGNYDDFTMVITIGYTGLRYGGDDRPRTRVRPARTRSTSNGSSARSAARSTGSPPRTTPTAARIGNPCLPLDLPPFLACWGPAASRPSPGNDAPAPTSTAAADSTCSSAPTAAITGAAATPAACSARPATGGGGTCHPAAPALARSSRTPTSGRASLIRRLATRPARRPLCAAALPGHTGHSRGHPARLLAAAEARPDAARLEARRQNMDG